MGFLVRFLFPQSPRNIPKARVWNIGFRTAHIGVTGVVFGGHMFDISEQQLLLWLYLSIVTGAGLVFLEAFPHGRWLYQGRGVMVLTKLVLLCSIPWLWTWRVYILAVVIVLASVGSHMPARFRYYSVIHGRVLDD